MSQEDAKKELKRRQAIAAKMGGPDGIARQRKRGRLTARERLDKLLDPDTWMELGALEMFTTEEGEEYHANKLRGYGRIKGRIVYVQSDDATVLAGTGGKGVSGNVRQRGLHSELDPKQHFPIIRLGESGGVHLQSSMGSTGVLSVTFRSQSLLNPRKSPRVTAIMGNCFGDPSWRAAMSDFVVQVKGTCMAVSGPRVLEVALSERPTLEQLGGWELHAYETGQVDAFAEDDEHCMEIIQEFLSYLPSNCDEEFSRLEPSDPPDRKAVKLEKLIPEKRTKAYDMYRVIKQIVDDGKYFDLKPFFGTVLITCLARMNGRVVGFIANQPWHKGGAAGPEECEKATCFITLCDSYNIPLIHLADTPGFRVGLKAEKKKMPLKIMTWMEALALATVPKMTVIIRKSYGMGISNMCGPNCGADFMAALTTADISFMDPNAAANVVWSRQIEAADDPEAERARLIKEMEYGNAPWQAAADGWLDDVLEPADIRKYLIDRLELMHERRDGFLSKKLLQNWPTGF